MKVNLTKRVSTPLGFRYYPVVTSANGRVKPDWVLVNGAEEKITGGSYYLEWREGNRRVRLSVGKIATTAVSRKMRKESELLAVSRGVSVVPEADQGADAGKHSVQAAVADFLEETKLTKKPKTYAAYQGTLAYFLESCPKLYMEDIERSDMLKFAGFLKDKGLAPRTCWNKFNNTMSFLKANGIRGIVNKNDWPKFVEEEPQIYEKRDIAALMAVSDKQETLWWEFFLMTGLREQEVMYMTWRDVDFGHHMVSVRWKPEYNWTPKAYKERTVPVPEKLIVKLRGLKAESRPGCPLVFPTAGCKPKLDFLDCLKTVAKRAGLDETEFYLHKFRATFATWSLWAGVDLRTVQSWLGHSDLESTLRYLKPSRSKETRSKVDAIFA